MSMSMSISRSFGQWLVDNLFVCLIVLCCVVCWQSLSATERNVLMVESNVERRQMTGRQDVDHDFVCQSHISSHSRSHTPHYMSHISSHSRSHRPHYMSHGPHYLSHISSHSRSHRPHYMSHGPHYMSHISSHSRSHRPHYMSHISSHSRSHRPHYLSHIYCLHVATDCIVLARVFFICLHDNSWSVAHSLMQFCGIVYFYSRSKPREFQRHKLKSRSFFR